MKTTRTPRAQRMWANYYKGNFLPALHPSRKSSIQHCAPSVEHKSIPVAVVPLDDVEGLAHCAAEAYFSAWNAELATRKEAMRAALAAIGVLPRKGGRK